MINTIAHLKDKVAILQSELHRCRTTENASAHALDTIRQHFSLIPIDGEHPMTTAERIIKQIESLQGDDE